MVDGARRYLRGLDRRLVRSPVADAALARFDVPLPVQGHGALPTLDLMTEHAPEAATHSAGPRAFHFVIGGTTPAALGADWLTSLLDQNGVFWSSSPLAATLETVSLRWLREMFGLPADWGGVLTPSATFANLTALAAARHWWGEQHGVDVDEQGLAGLPPMPVLSGGYVNVSVRKALQLLGFGRQGVQVCARDDAGRVDVEALDAALGEVGGPAVIVGNAGEVNAGDFDPLGELADVAERHGAWLHVDGAFGLLARLSPLTAPLLDGVERAQSVVADAHKWLNVPHESGFAFVKDASLLGRTFAGAALLANASDARPSYGLLGPESSRRARALPLWATLHAYGSDGYRAMVERHLALAQRLARQVEAAPDLELLAEVKLCVVSFRYRADGLSGAALDRLNEAIGAELMAEARVYVGVTRYRGRVAFRPAIVNWRTTEADVDLIVSAVREAGARFRSSRLGSG